MPPGPVHTGWSPGSQGRRVGSHFGFPWLLPPLPLPTQLAEDGARAWLASPALRTGTLRHEAPSPTRWKLCARHDEMLGGARLSCRGLFLIA